MKDKFQAKDIQEIVGISKSRYEYLATKIGISPDVEEVEGTGRSHLYSFKNLLQFAYSHHANDLGLSPKATKEMLLILNRFNNKMKQISQNISELSETGINVNYFPQRTNSSRPLIYPLDPNDNDPEVDGHYASNTETGFELNYIKKTNYSMFQLARTDKGLVYYTDENNKILVNDFTIKESNLGDAIGFIAINIGTIKKRILHKNFEYFY